MDAPLPRAYRRKRRVRTGLGAGVAILVTLLVAVWAAHLETRSPAIARAQLWTGKVKRGDFAMRVQGAGVLRPEEVLWLTAESPGRVDAVLVKPGVRVTPATTVVRLENLDLQLQADQALRDVQAVQAQALALEHQQGQDELSLEQQLGTLRDNLSDAHRLATTYEEGAGLIVSRNDSERQHDRALTLTDQVRLAQDKLVLLRRLGPRQRAVAEAQSAQLERVYAVRRQMLERLFVRAPADGIVQELLVEPGQWVLSGAAVAKLRVSDRLEALLRIPADQVGAVALEQRAFVRTGFGRTPQGTIAGRVRRIAPAAQDSTVDVEVALEGPLPPSARPDQAVDGTIETRLIPGALSLPRPMNLPLGDTVSLYRIDDATGLANRVQVQVGLVSTDAVQILGGLNEGDEVILSDLNGYADRGSLRLE